MATGTDGLRRQSVSLSGTRSRGLSSVRLGVWRGRGSRLHSSPSLACIVFRHPLPGLFLISATHLHNVLPPKDTLAPSPLAVRDQNTPHAVARVGDQRAQPGHSSSRLTLAKEGKGGRLIQSLFLESTFVSSPAGSEHEQTGLSNQTRYHRLSPGLRYLAASGQFWNNQERRGREQNRRDNSRLRTTKDTEAIQVPAKCE